MSRPSFSRALTLGLAGFLFVAASAEADELRVVSSGGFAAAYRALAPEFERESGVTLVSQWGPSMGDTPQAVPARLARGEQIDVVIVVGYALGNLATQGKVVADSCVELARSGIPHRRPPTGASQCRRPDPGESTSQRDGNDASTGTRPRSPVAAISSLQRRVRS